jgi:hypothetical protein
VRTRRGTNRSTSWDAFYAGASSDASRRQKSTTSFALTADAATKIRSHSVRITTDSVITALEELALQEQFGKVAMELRKSSCGWYERYSSEGHRGILLRVMGQPYSKANSRRIVTGRDGRRMVIKSEEALDYARQWRSQVPTLRFPLTGEVRVVGALMYSSMRPDLDESLILDLAQDMIYKNDRQVTQKFFVRGVDTERPRAVLLFEETLPTALELPLDSPPSDQG